MSEASKRELAQKVYDSLCQTIRSRNWRFQEKKEQMMVRFGVVGDDIPMRFVMVVDEERRLVRLLSRLPFTMREDRRTEGAIAACACTYGLANGCFDYNIHDGSITFRMTASYRESVIGEGLFNYMIDCAAATVDEFNDKLYALNEGLLDISAFLG